MAETKYTKWTGIRLYKILNTRLRTKTILCCCCLMESHWKFLQTGVTDERALVKLTWQPKGRNWKQRIAGKVRKWWSFSKIGTLANSPVRLLVFQLPVHVQKVCLFCLLLLRRTEEEKRWFLHFDEF